MKENGQSLEKRSKLVPEKLMRGGLIVGVETGIQGSLMSVTGAAIERITRERTEVPPQFKLPERSVYFLDPNTRRLIMISNRENRGENKTPDKYGLFAEIVELDEEGKPHYRLSTSEIILTNDSYQLVAVGPNTYGLPPSHIEVIEEEGTGKKKFVPWNLWLGNLQNWMNEVKIDTGEDFDTFVERFSDLKRRNGIIAEGKIAEAFPYSLQGVSDETAPINVIITDKGKDSLLFRASLDAGFYPVLLNAKQLAEFHNDTGGWMETQIKTLHDMGNVELVFALHQYLPAKSYLPYRVAVITLDQDADDEIRRESSNPPLMYIVSEFLKYNPIFGLVKVRDESKPFEDPEMEKKFQNSAWRTTEAKKYRHGDYFSPYEEEQYRGLLNKLKADLLLTMFLRGGAPIIK